MQHSCNTDVMIYNSVAGVSSGGCTQVPWTTSSGSTSVPGHLGTRGRNSYSVFCVCACRKMDAPVHKGEEQLRPVDSHFSTHKY